MDRRDDPTIISPGLRAAARDLRKTMTPAESRLWERVRRRQLNGLHIRKQHPFGPYILDFACLPLRLGVELDGAVHDGQVDYDRDRDEFLAAHGWTMLRFRNEEVVADLEGVARRIAETARLIAERFG